MTALTNAVRPLRAVFSGLAALLLALLLTACSVTIGAPQPTPGPGDPLNTPIEQVHFDITAVPSPTAVPPTPTGAAPAPAPGSGGTAKYTIKPGDTLSGIAAQYNITVDDLVKLNNIANPNDIQAGQVIVVPAAPAPAATRAPTPAPTKVP